MKKTAMLLAFVFIFTFSIQAGWVTEIIGGFTQYDYYEVHTFSATGNHTFTPSDGAFTGTLNMVVIGVTGSYTGTVKLKGIMTISGTDYEVYLDNTGIDNTTEEPKWWICGEPWQKYKVEATLSGGTCTVFLGGSWN